MEIEGAVCAICYGDVEWDEALALGLFLNKHSISSNADDHKYQQWYVHPHCAKEMFHEAMLDTVREELAATWGTSE